MAMVIAMVAIVTVDMETAMVMVAIAMVDIVVAMEMAMATVMVAIATVAMEAAMEDMEVAMVVMEEMVMEAAAMAPTINTFYCLNYYFIIDEILNKTLI